MVKEQKSIIELIAILDPKMSLHDIISDLVWCKKERERLRKKDEKKRDERKAIKEALLLAKQKENTNQQT
jgi:hypothetical protein